MLLLKAWTALSIGVLVTTIIATGAYGVMSVNRNVSSIGVVYTNTTPNPTDPPAILNLAIYKDNTCTQEMTTINWGSVTPGSTATYVFYVKNTGNTRETVTLSTTGWSPSAASQYITLTWNKNGAIIDVGEVVEATLTLTVSANIDSAITSFSNTIVVTGAAA